MKEIKQKKKKQTAAELDAKEFMEQKKAELEAVELKSKHTILKAFYPPIILSSTVGSVHILGNHGGFSCIMVWGQHE